MADDTKAANLDAFAADLSEQVLAELKLQLRDSWEKMKPEVVEGLTDCAKMVAKLAARKLKGEDVSALQTHVEAQIANLVVIGEDLAVKNFWIAVYKTLGIAGNAIGAFAAGALAGAVAGAL